MRLSADLIPHEDFHKGYWLKENKCPWFFFYETPREYYRQHLLALVTYMMMNIIIRFIVL